MLCLYTMLFKRLNLETKYKMGVSETSFVKAINLGLFTLTSGRLFRQVQNVATFITKIPYFEIHLLGHSLGQAYPIPHSLHVIV